MGNIRFRGAAIGLMLALSLQAATSYGQAVSPRLGADLTQTRDALAEQLRQDQVDILGLATLNRALQVSEWIPWAAWTDVLEEIASSETAHQVVQQEAIYQLALAYFAAGDSQRAEQWLQSQGYVSDWWLIGPFPSDTSVGFDQDFPVEQERQLQTYQGKVQEISWRHVADLTRLGFVNVTGLCQPSNSSVAYAAQTISLDRRQSARLWLQIDGQFKVWVNGRLVAAGDDFGFHTVSTWWDIELARGQNEIVIKVAAEDTAAGFRFNLTDRDGNPLDFEPSADFQPSTVSLSGSAPTAVAGTVLDEVNALLAEQGDPTFLTQSRAAQAVWNSRPRDPDEPWRSFVSLDQCREESTAAFYCTSVLEHDWQKKQVLEAAYEWVEQGSLDWAWIAYNLADLHGKSLGVDGALQSQRILENVIALRAEFVPALTAYAEMFAYRDLPAASAQMFRDALSIAPDSPLLLRRAAQTEQAIGLTPTLLELLQRQLDLSVAKHQHYTSLISRLMQLRQFDTAHQLIEDGLTNYPFSLLLLAYRSDLAVAIGDEETAEGSLTLAVQRVPGDAMSWAQLGAYYLRASRQLEAAEALEVALQIEPQNPEYAALLSQLQQEEHFYDSYQLDPERIRAAHIGELGEGHDAVYVVDQTITKVHSNGLATRFSQRAIRTLSRQGADQYRTLSIQYTPGEQSVDIINARVIKADGSIVESYSRREESLSQPWYGIYYDLRLILIQFDDLEAGDTVELTYTLSDIAGSNMFDDYFGDFWYVQDVIPKLFTRYGLLIPENTPLAIREPVLQSVTSADLVDEQRVHLYALFDVPPIKYEAGMPGFSSVADYVHVSTFQTWDDVANWYWNLAKDQLVSSPQIQETVDELIADATTVEERVTAIHEYVVRNTRYVGLEFGIQGYRPHRTTLSFERRFGDCKDTATLMKLMLALAGVESFVVLVRTRDMGLIEEDPASLAVFNHAITFVPELDLFLDGTAGHAGLNELPSGDQGASVLIVHDGQGGEFRSIPRSPPSHNEIIQELRVDFGAGGTTEGLLTASGVFAPDLRRRFEATEHQVEDFQRELRDRYPGARVTTLEFQGLEDIRVPVQATYTFEGVNWFDFTGALDRMPMLGYQSQLASQIAGPAEREQPLDFPFSFRRTFHIEYRLPPGWVLTSGEQSSGIAQEWGQASVEVSIHEEHVAVDVTLELAIETIDPDSYPAFRAFLQEIDRMLNVELTVERADDG